MNDTVSYALYDGIAVIMIDSPPVNAVDRVLRAGLKKVPLELRDQTAIKAIVLGCAGKTFVAGADIKEFDTGIAEPDVLVTAMELAKRIKKTGGVAKVCYGFIGNRMMDPYGREAERCLYAMINEAAPLLKKLALSGSSFAQWQAEQTR